MTAPPEFPSWQPHMRQALIAWHIATVVGDGLPELLAELEAGERAARAEMADRIAQLDAAVAKYRNPPEIHV